MMILNRKRIEIEAATTSQMSGEYRMVVRRVDGSVKRDTGWFQNLILDGGLNRIGTNRAGDYCVIGTGTAAPAANQSSLQSLSASVQGYLGFTTGVQTSAPYFQSVTVTYRFALGSLNGNYSEVGIGWATTQLFSRALIVDQVGAPTTITVLSDEQLDVVYRLRLYAPSADWSGSINISGSTHNFIGRAAYSTNDYWPSFGAPLFLSSGIGVATNAQPQFYDGSIGSVTGGPSGYPISGDLPVNQAYANNSMTSVSVLGAGLSSGNVAGGIKSLVLWNKGTFAAQYQFTPNIMKDSNKTLSLVVSQSWSRRP